MPPPPRSETGVNITIFAIFIVITLAIVLRAARQNRTANEYYAAGAHSAAGRTGSRSPVTTFRGELPRDRRRDRAAGYDCFLYSIGFLVAWLVALLLVAELLRNTGRFTMADVSASGCARARADRGGDLHAVRQLLLPAAQMAGAGGLVNLLLGSTGTTGQDITIARVGILMIIYVLVGGMKGTTWVQIIKALLLIAGAA
jgi:cation/acetate symporter